MRATTASIILAFCAMVAVQGAPASSDSAVVARTEPWTYDSEDVDSDGNEIEQDSASDPFTYDSEGNEVGVKIRGTHDFEYNEDGSELETREPKKKAKKARFLPPLIYMNL
ncbi:uncharacterized protein PAC_04247 [Phialocephala subalpina]|uniref:Uncharacterized protein n=1 Tax=Phialocephala subalpina TaxID=576137 RepID=A0A1L7WNN1_9HELO|nr:uncharacterized protein PAC_04247 [Phialocephala subalpina]